MVCIAKTTSYRPLADFVRAQFPLVLLILPRLLFSRDEEEHSKKYHVPRRRRLGFPPITPNACVRDAVLQQIFDRTWNHVIFCLSGPTDTKPTPLLKVKFWKFLKLFNFGC